MLRRNIVKGVLAAGATLLSGRAFAAEADGISKVVYHLADAEKVRFVLGNIENHYEGVGGPSHVRIALVVHGPALAAFRLGNAAPDLLTRANKLNHAGLTLHACGNTMKGMNLTLAELPPGFVIADKGGVVRLVELQAQGYFYLRP